MLKHGETVIFDSNGILRYLDANFPDTPRLYTEDYAQFGEIEEWEMWSKTEMSLPVRTIFGQFFAPEPDLDACRQASEAMHEATGRIEAALEKNPFVMGEVMKAPDIVCAVGVNLAMISEAAASGPIMGFFQTHFHLGEGRERTREWVRRVMAHDPLFVG